MSILTVRNLNVFYNSVEAVKNATFSVEPGDFVCIVGMNGSGKSTLVKAVLGLTSAEGDIQFGVPPDQIGYMPQVSSIEEGFPATVWEMVLSGTQKSGKRLPFYSPANKLMAKAMIKKFKIEPIVKKRIGELSGGQRQRVLLARAMCRSPKLLFLDEPCAGLDESITDELNAILNNLNQKSKITIVMVSHDSEQVEKMASKVIEMNKTLKFYQNVSDWERARDKRI